MRIVYRGVYAGFPAAALHTGNLAYATDLLVLFQSNGTAWVAYSDYPDYQGEKAGLYLKAEWSAFEGTDRNFQAVAYNQPYGAFTVVAYLVPAGRVLYISAFSFRCLASAAADADNNQMVLALLFNWTTGITQVAVGGNGGGFVALPKPIVFTAGQLMQLWVTSYANHLVDISITGQGYEV